VKQKTLLHQNWGEPGLNAVAADRMCGDIMDEHQNDSRRSDKAKFCSDLDRPKSAEMSE
jgi:hypothetical protein